MGRPPIGKTAMTGAERVRRYRLKHGTDKPVNAHEAKIAALKKELAQAKAAMTQMHLERDELKRRAAKPKVERPALTPDEARDKRLEALTKENQRLKAHILLVVGQSRNGSMNFKTMSAIAKPLHPEQRKHMTRTELDAACDEAFKVFTSWKADNNKAQRKAR
jgi:hypothetical protein